MNILLTWLGTADIESMQQDNAGTIATIASFNEIPFDRIVILANHREEVWEQYSYWLSKRMSMLGRPYKEIHIKNAFIETPIDYASITKTSKKWIDKLSQLSQDLVINLTSGTPAMTTISVLIGKGKTNTSFVQATRENRILNVDIPLNFAIEYTKSAAKNMASSAISLITNKTAFDSLIAYSPAMKIVKRQALRLAPTELPALIFGETGTGKEVLAKTLHFGSLRTDKQIKTVNCGAFPENLVESMLFGHVKGAFTGAISEHKGLFEQADGGTLFLDEVGELSSDIQVKLLRALQEGEVTRVGDDKTISVDVRVIAATHCDLMKMVEEGTFREDLFYRLAVGIISMPALRERKEDIPVLIEELMQEINEKASKQPNYMSKKISQSAINFIIDQLWLGNIRELWNTLNRAFLWSDNQVLSHDDIENALITRQYNALNANIYLSATQPVDINQLVDNYKEKYVQEALKVSGGNKTKAAKMLGLKSHQVFTKWMADLNIIAQ